MRLIELESGERLVVVVQRVTSEKLALVVTNSDDDRVATFTWNDFTGEIGSVTVESCVGEKEINYKRKGIATALLGIANTYMPIKHSVWRTGSGDAWAKSTGDPLPPINRGLHERRI